MDVAELAGHVRRGMVPALVYSDADVFALERERLFARAWILLAHESEIPEPGDFVVRRVVDDSFIVARDDRGNAGVHLNVCRHRGMQVCRAELGRTSHFRCPYHGWTYRTDGTLASVPFRDDAYGDDGVPPDGERLLPAPSMATYNGLIFVSLDPAAPALADYLGDFTFYLDLYTGQSADGIEVRGPQRWRIGANWKIACENFAGDMYHTPYTHHSVVDIGLFREPTAAKRKEGVVYEAGRGSGTTYKLPAGDFRQKLHYVGYPDDMIDRMEATWSDAQRSLVGRDGFMVSAATVFPNFSLVHNWPRRRDGGDVVPFISLRQWQPVSATETEVLSWFAVDRNAPADLKDASYQAYLACFGSSGMFEQDDVENWVSITEASRGVLAGRLLLNSRMGLNAAGEPLRPPLEGFAGPGTARVGFGEFNQRGWLARWADYLTADGR
jgi:phenylpropionate dioxygenase-like ring-hydroxylating dioxygenase large terminal subunit